MTRRSRSRRRSARGARSRKGNALCAAAANSAARASARRRRPPRSRRARTRARPGRASSAEPDERRSFDSADSDADPVWGVANRRRQRGTGPRTGRTVPRRRTRALRRAPEEVRRSFEPRFAAAARRVGNQRDARGSKTHIRPPPCVVQPARRPRGARTNESVAEPDVPRPNRKRAADENARVLVRRQPDAPRLEHHRGALELGEPRLEERTRGVRRAVQDARTLDARGGRARKGPRGNDESSYRGRSLRRVRGSGHARRTSNASPPRTSRGGTWSKRSAAACETECTSRRAPTPAAEEEGLVFFRGGGPPSRPLSALFFFSVFAFFVLVVLPEEPLASFRASARAGAMTPRRSGRKNAPDASVVASPRSRRDAAQHSASDAASASRSGESPPPPVRVLVPVLFAFESSAPGAFESFARRFAASKKSIGSNASRTPSASRSAPRLASLRRYGAGPRLRQRTCDRQPRARPQPPRAIENHRDGVQRRAAAPAHGVGGIGGARQRRVRRGNARARASAESGETRWSSPSSRSCAAITAGETAPHPRRSTSKGDAPRGGGRLGGGSEAEEAEEAEAKPKPPPPKPPKPPPPETRSPPSKSPRSPLPAPRGIPPRRIPPPRARLRPPRAPLSLPRACLPRLSPPPPRRRRLGDLQVEYAHGRQHAHAISGGLTALAAQRVGAYPPWSISPPAPGPSSSPRPSGRGIASSGERGAPRQVREFPPKRRRPSRRGDVLDRRVLGREPRIAAAAAAARRRGRSRARSFARRARWAREGAAPRDGVGARPLRDAPPPPPPRRRRPRAAARLQSARRSPASNGGAGKCSFGSRSDPKGTVGSKIPRAT